MSDDNPAILTDEEVDALQGIDNMLATALDKLVDEEDMDEKEIFPLLEDY